MIRPQSQLERDLGFGSFNGSDRSTAVKVMGLTISAFIFLIFPGLFFIGGIAMIIYAGLAYFLNVSDRKKVRIGLQRLGVVLLFFLAQAFSILLVVPIVYLVLRYTWIFVPERYRKIVMEEVPSGNSR